VPLVDVPSDVAGLPPAPAETVDAPIVEVAVPARAMRREVAVSAGAV